MNIRRTSLMILTAIFTVFLSVANAAGQSEDKPVYTSYKGIGIGTPAAEARAKLGDPRDKSDSQDFFVFSDNENAQVIYGPDKCVSVISATYLGNLDAAPTAKAVFGTDAEAKPDGAIFKLVRYPKAGYWVSYHRTGGADPMIIVTVQKIP